MATMREILEIGIVASGATLVGDQIRKLAGDTTLLATAEQRQAVAAAESAKAIAIVNRDATSSALALAKLSNPTGYKGGAEDIAAAQASTNLKIARNDLSTANVGLSSKEKELAAATDSASASQGRFGGMLGGLGITAAVAGFTALSAVVVKGVDHFVSLGATIRGVQGVMGGSAEQASLLVGQMSALGIDADTGTKALGFLGAQLGGAAASLHGMGVETKYFANGNVDVYGTLGNVQAAIAGTTDASEKDAIAKVALGRGYLTLNALLKQTPEYLAAINEQTKASGNVFSDKELVDAKNLKVALNEMKMSIDGLVLSLVKGLGPGLIGTLHVFTDLTSGLRNNRAEQAVFAGVITAVVVPALLRFAAAALGPALSAAWSLGGSLLGLGGAATVATPAVAGAGVAAETAGVGFSAMLGPIGLAAGALAFLYVALNKASSAEKDAKAAGDALAQTFTQTLSTKSPQEQMDALKAKVKETSLAIYDHGEALKIAAATGQPLGIVEGALKEEAKTLAAQMIQLAIATAATAAATDKDTAAKEAQIAAYLDSIYQADQLSAAVSGSADAGQALAAAQKAEGDAVTANSKAVADYTALLNGGVAADKDYVAALKSETSAQEALNKAQTTSTALELAVANNKLAQSFDNIALAADDVNDKQTKLNELLAGGSGATVNEVQRARDELALAKDKAAQAPLDYQNAGVDLTAAKLKGTAVDPAVVAAKATLNDAQTVLAAAAAAFPAKLADAKALVDSTAVDIVTKQWEIYKATMTANRAADTLKTTIATTGTQAYQAVINQLGPLAGILEQTARLGRAADVPAYLAALDKANTLQPVTGARAAGGPVEPYGTYLVGENRPELLHIGSRGGYIQPNTGGGSSPLVGTLSVTAQSGASAQDIAREVSWQLNNVVPAARSRAA